jgi:archaellum component FlaC
MIVHYLKEGNLKMPENSKQVHNGTATASLDRVDSAKGYIKGNVQWVHKDINMMKQQYSQEYFIQMCRLTTEHSKGIV